MLKSSIFLAAMLLLGQAAFIGPAAAADASSAYASKYGIEPLGNPGDWIVTDDYPAAALSESREGLVKFRLDVNDAGTVSGCTVLVSSGSADLDFATCDLTTKRARFQPARDIAGHGQPRFYAGSVNWVVPKMTPPPPSHVVTRYTIDADGTFTHCEIIEVSGAGKDLPALGAFPCRSRTYSEGYVDAAGKSVPRQLTITTTATVTDVPEPAPTH